MVIKNTYKTFPTIADIAHMGVMTVDEQITVEKSIEIMATNNMRDVIFYDHDKQYHRVFLARNLVDNARSLLLKDTTAPKLQCVYQEKNILQVYPQLEGEDEYFGVLNQENLLCGIVSYTDITSSIDPKMLIEKKTVGELIRKTPVFSLSPETKTSDVFFYLDRNDKAVLVVEAGEILGILTSKDMIDIIHQKQDTSMPVHHYMVSPVNTLLMDTSIKDALSYLQETSYKRAVIVDHQEHFLGAVTQHDLTAYAYSHWAELIRLHTTELHELVGMLEKKASNFEIASRTDSLTGIGNRHHFNLALESEVGRFYRYRKGVFTLLMLDIDHFKKVNDQYGHLRGDDVLKHLVQIIKSSVRDTDVLSRWGGEEFVVLLPLTELQYAQVLAERIRHKVSTTDFSDIEQITVSIGLGQYQENESVEEFVNRIDQALYVAKQSGRNQCSTS